MKRFATKFAFATVLAAGSAGAADNPPEWAYPINPPGFKPKADDGTPRRVEGSTASYTLTQLRDRFFSPVWYPAEHPQQPEVVARGRKPDVFACGFCHRADGPGGPENANLAGLPAAYIKQQMADYRSGARRTSVPGRNVDLMISLAKAANEAEIDAAAAYFASLRTRGVVRVVESDSVPRSYVTGWHFASMGKGEQEALGRRIVEMPEVFEQFENRDTHARFIAYAPSGSIEKGRALAAGGEGKTVQCAGCHGPELKGVGLIPPIAGRSPSYIVRQLYDFKNGMRAGAAAGQMKPTVENLTVDDMIALAAYAASLAP